MSKVPYAIEFCVASRSCRLFHFFTRTWSKTEDLRFSVKLGLRKGLKLIRRMRRLITDGDQDKIAQPILAGNGTGKGRVF